jgi:hypothetical protein
MGNTSLTVTDPAAVAAAAKEQAVIQAAYIMALRCPRDEADARQKLIKECQRTSFAHTVEYSKPQGGTKVSGPTVRLIEVALRLWKNIASRTSVVYEDAEIRRVQVTVIDYETNTQHVKEIQVPKTVERSDATGREVLGQRVNKQGRPVYRVAATEDEVDQRTASLVSKVIRNEGKRLLPGDLIDEALDTARETRRQHDKTDPDAAKKRVTDGFATINVMPSALAEYLGHTVDTCSPVEIDDLRLIFQGIRDGLTTWGEVIGMRKAQNQANTPKDPAAPDGEKPASVVDKLKAKAKADADAKARAKDAAAPPQGNTIPASTLPPGAPGKTAEALAKEKADAEAKAKEDARLAEERAKTADGSGYCGKCGVTSHGAGIKAGAICPACKMAVLMAKAPEPLKSGRGGRRQAAPATPPPPPPAPPAPPAQTDDEKAMAVMKEAAAKDKAAREAAEAAPAQGNLMDVEDVEGDAESEMDAEEQALLDAAAESEAGANGEDQ